MRALVFWGLLFVIGAGAAATAGLIMTHKVGYGISDIFDPNGFKTAVLHYPGSGKGALQAALFGGAGVGLISFLILGATWARIKKQAGS
jgi:hypothetical protein